MTSDELITAVREAMSGANTGVLGTDDAAILSHLNKALFSKIIPEVLKAREEYYGASTQVTITPGTSRYRLPSRAMFNKLRSVLLYSTSNGYEPIIEIDPPLRRNYSSGDWSVFRKAYFEGNDLVLVPPVAGSSSPGALEFSFYFRPGDLVLTSTARQVTAVNLTTKAITLATVPTTFVGGVNLDIHSQLSGAEIKAWDNPIASILLTVLTMTNAIDGSIVGTRPVAVGDWVCLQNQSVVPGIPQEFNSLLADAAALRLLKAAGDPNLKAQAQILREETDSLREVIESRDESRPLRLKGRGGLLRAGRL